MRRLVVFTATMVLVLAVSAINASADPMTIVTPTSPAHIEGLTVTVDPDLGDVSVINAIFISNPGEDGIVTVQQISTGALVNVVLQVRTIDGVKIIDIIPPGGDVICDPKTDPGCT